MMPPRAARPFAAACLLFALVGCGKSPTPPAPSPSTDRPAAAPVPTANPADPPTGQPEGTEFTFDQAARYDDGVLVEVGTIKATKATATQQGAEGTGGEVVIAEILISNQSKEPFVADKVIVHGFYSGVGAPKLVDPSGAVGDSLRGTIPPGGQAKATMGFAIPASQLDEVTIMVDGGDDAHGPLQFKGSVEMA